MPIYLYITPFFPSEKSWRGGFCLDAVKAIRRTGKFDVRVAVMGSGESYEYEGFRVIALGWKTLPLEIAPYLMFSYNRRNLLKALRREGIDVNKVAVCHSNVYPEPSYILKKENPSCKAIWQTHRMGEPFNIENYHIGAKKGICDLQYLYWRKMLEGVDCVALLSERHKKLFGKALPEGPLGNAIDLREQTLLKRYRAITPKKTVVFYNGIDKSVFTEDENGRNKHRKEKPLFVIGCVANFGPYKGQMVLLKAIKRLRDKIGGLRVKLVGSGPQIENCKPYVVSNGLSDIVEFINECDHLELPKMYRSFDLFVLPTTCEGFCCTLVEAVGCGVPAIATRAVSFEEVIPVDDKNKWLCEPNDDVDLSEKIYSYYCNRYAFRFNQSLDINDLWRKFLGEVL